MGYLPERAPMRPALLFLALAALPLAAPAETVDLGPAGHFTLAAPPGWTATVKRQPEAGTTIVLKAPPDVNANCVVNVISVPKDEPLTNEAVREKVLSLADQFVDDSVEKKKVLRYFGLAHGYGCYCVFTDASRVGKPPEKDNFKVVMIGLIRFNDDLAAVVSLLADDTSSPEYAAMLNAVTSSGPSK
jgi:hypothetical protein